ncbi:MAG TPA: DUF1800 domain-containing protein [Candidatus Binatia bacterium]|nr:DUF1800 domain-containing protein [Candidatus Binatia bacterium]
MPLSRREFLQQVAALYPAGLALAGCGRSGTTGQAAPSAGTAVESLPAPSPLVHLLKRTRFGITQADFDHAAEIGMAAYVEEQLAPASLPPDAELVAAAKWPLYPLPALLQYSAYLSSYELATQHLSERTLFMASYSARQLYEVMVEFWTNHFNVENLTGELPVLKMRDDRDVIRANALGLFRDLLFATAKSPAMIVRLDNASNVKAAPNQNYARELMELHTIGIDGGYDEMDVMEVARCFTGWSWDTLTREFTFVPEAHDDGEKMVLGHTIPAGGGIADGEFVLDLLASHPSTARYLATKLVRRFVADDPPAALVTLAERTFRDSGGRIPAVLRALLLHPSFADYADAKLHRPLEYVAGALRALSPVPLAYFGPDAMASVERMGQRPHRWVPPDGFPDSTRYWLSTVGLMERWNFAAALCETGFPNPPAQNRIGAEETPASLVDKLAAAIVHRELRPQDRARLIAWIGNSQPDRLLRDQELKDAADALGGVLLSSPYFVLR